MRGALAIAAAVLFLDEILFNLIVPLLPRYAERFDLSTAEVGLVVAAYPLLMLVVGVPGGLLVARLGSRTALLGGTSLLVASTVAAGLASTLAQLLLARATLGLASGVTLTAAIVTVAAATPRASRGRALATLFAIAGLGAILGPAVGGILMPAVGLEAGHLMLAGLAAAIVVAGLACSWPAGSAAPSESAANSLRLLARPAALRSGAAILVSGLAGGAVQTLAPLRLEDAGLSEAAIGLVFVAGLATGTLGSRPIGGLADRYGAALVTCGPGAVVVLALLGLAADPRTAGVATFALAVAAGGYCLSTLSYILGSDVASEHRSDVLGPIFGLMMTAWGAGAVVGPPLAGAIADGPGPAAAYVTVAILCLALLAPIAAMSRQRLTRVEAP